jgi:hypothetical protein
MKAHFGLGYTLVELGRPHEAFGHLSMYTEDHAAQFMGLALACPSRGGYGRARGGQDLLPPSDRGRGGGELRNRRGRAPITASSLDGDGGS